MTKAFLCLLAGLTITLAGGMTPYRSHLYTTTDALASNSVRCIFQDREGYIWFGSLDGLTRYDGYTFLPIEERGEERIWTDKYVKLIQEDRFGHIWLITNSKQIFCYDKAAARFLDYTGRGAYRDSYNHLFFPSSGDVWLWHDSKGCRRVSCQGGVFTAEDFNMATGLLPSNRLWMLEEAPDGAVLACTDAGMVRITESGIRVFVPGEDCRFVAVREDSALLLTAEGILYLQQGDDCTRIGTFTHPGADPFDIKDGFICNGILTVLAGDGIYSFDLAARRQTDPPVRSRFIDKTRRDENGDIWWSENTGIISCIDTRTGKVLRLPALSREQIVSLDIERFAVTAAPDGTKWVSTFGNGLFACHPGEDGAEHFQYRINAVNQIPSDFLLCVKADRYGNIWTGSEYQGISLLVPPQAGLNYHFPENETLTDRSNTLRMVREIAGRGLFVSSRKGRLYRYTGELETRDKTVVLEDAPVTDIVRDRSGSLWYASRTSGICLNGAWYQHDPQNPASIASNVAYDLLEDQAGRMWVATFGGGLDLAVPQEDGSLRFRHFLPERSSLASVRCLAEDRQGRIWAGTNGGLVCFLPDSLMADPSAFRIYNAENGLLAGNEIRSILSSHDGRIWCAVAGSGVSCGLQESNNLVLFRNYGVRDGLVNPVVQSLVEDAQGRIWIGTEYGISCFTPSTDRFQNYLPSPTEAGNVCLEGAACRMGDGRLVFGTNHGFVIMDPDRMATAAGQPEISLTGLTINGEQQPLSVLSGGMLRLKHPQNSFRISFSTMQPAVSDNILYAFSFRPDTPNFGSLQSENFLQFNNLRPGRYALSLKAVNSSGQWSPEETLRIRILPSPWLSPAAITLYVLLGLSLLALLFVSLNRIASANERVRMERQINEEKLNFFTVISHEFRTPLTIIRNSAERMSEDAAQGRASRGRVLSVMEHNIERLMRLVNQLLEFRKVQEGRFVSRPSALPLREFIDGITSDFEELAASRQLTITVDAENLPGKVFLDTVALDTALYNLLSNAVKYSPDQGEIHCAARADDTCGVVIEVSDHGQGIPVEQRGQLFGRFTPGSGHKDSMGIGLHISKTLLNAVGGDLSYRPNEPCGSVFRIEIPLVREADADPDIQTLLLFREEQSRRDPAPIQSSLPHPHAGSGSRILIVEDNADIRDYLLDDLSSDYEVRVAEDGAAGLKCVRENEPDIILCDILMPRMNGYEMVSALKADFSTSHLPVIMMTALCNEEDEIQARNCGADAYIKKPFRIKLLKATLDQILRSREELRRRFTVRTASVPVEGASATPGLSGRDAVFLDQFRAMVDTHLSEAGFSTEHLYQELGVSRTVYYRKVRSLLACSPNDFLRDCRMEQAALLLRQQGDLNISEISYKVGIDDPLYFSRCFRKHFGMSPRQFRENAN